MQTLHQLVFRMVCLPLQMLQVLFGGMGATNRVRIIFLIFCALQCCQQRTEWNGLDGGHLDDVVIKVHMLKIVSDIIDIVRSGRSYQSTIDISYGNVLSTCLGAFGHLSNVQV